MAALFRSQRYFRASHRVPVDVRHALARTVEDLDGAESLPGLDDVFDVIPPTQHVYRRRIGASAWWVYYALRPDGVGVLVAVAIPMA